MGNKATTSEAISAVAKQLREGAAKRGREMTQTEARKIVANARERGDQIRNNNNR